MKKTILLTLIAIMIATPCFAQQPEKAGIFSVNGTLWRTYCIEFYTMGPFVNIRTDEFVGFYQDTEYICDEYYGCRSLNTFTLFESPLATIAMNLFPSSMYREMQIYLYTGFGCSIGFGWGMACVPVLISHIGIALKVDDNWIPEETILSIYPEYGLQGTTTTYYLYSSLTTFERNSPVEITFNPTDGLTVSNIEIISDTSIEFDLEIADDAPVGTKEICVVYDDGKKVVDSSDALFGDVVFTVIPVGEILSISPNQVEQGTTLTGVTIMTKDTYFEDYGVGKIILFPAAGLTISNVNVISNTEMEFDLEIAVDAPVGRREVYVLLGGDKYLWNSEVFFTVTEKTN